MKVTNISKALQGVNTSTGQVYIRPGETKDVEFTKEGEKQAKRLSFLKFGSAAAKEAEKGGNTNQPSFEAKHRGGGSYSIVDASGAEVVEKLSKEDAEAFNAMSDADKAAYVAKK
ncbi:hypothetical protein [Chelativorans sp.]|uniref:hypothetical protein n=1 Tax=Chelativorans sp. TaxID=2203393 RepID=UPI002810E9D5|nr:hypothetical protein [Chelativorans sp.]